MENKQISQMTCEEILRQQLQLLAERKQLDLVIGITISSDYQGNIQELQDRLYKNILSEIHSTLDV